MNVQDARIHLNEAIEHLTLEAYRGRDPENMERDYNFTLAEELERIDRALGPKGSSLLYPMADSIRAAFVEIKAAREALR
jgi:hypothetical protein